MRITGLKDHELVKYIMPVIYKVLKEADYNNSIMVERGLTNKEQRAK